MSQTTPSGAELLATIDSNARALRYDGDVYTSDQLYEIHTAVDALIARNAELEAQVNALADDLDDASEFEDMCAALEAENKALREALEWIARVNAMDYEYVAVARKALARTAAKENDDG